VTKIKRAHKVINYALAFGKNYFLGSLAEFFPKIVPRPLYVGLSVGTICNLRCQQCGLWRVPTTPTKYLTTKQVKMILIQLRQWLGPFRLTFTGAEPFLRKDLFRIISFAFENDIETILTTNGCLIEHKIAWKIVNSGLAVLAVSLDGVKKETHDFLRGKKGVYQKVIKSLDLLTEARKTKKTPRIYLNTVIMENNLGELTSLVRLAKRKKIDGIRFEALESKYLFGNEEYSPVWFKKNPLWPGNENKTKKVFDKLIKMKKNGFPIKNSFVELEDLGSYYKNPLEVVKKHKFCFAGVRNFTIDEYGRVKLCFGMEPVGDLLKQPAKEIWFGRKAEKQRQKIAGCQRYCRILPCNRREEFLELAKILIKRLV